MYMEWALVIGKSLGLLNGDFAIYHKQFLALSQLQPWKNSKHPWQMVQNLMGLSENPFLLKGDIFDIESYSPEANNRINIVSSYMWRIILFHYLCNDEEGADLALDLFKKHPRKELNPGTLHED